MSKGEIDFLTEMEEIQSTFKKREVKISKPVQSEFPELTIRVPDSWKQIQLAPLYDVHIGSSEHDSELFERHLKWIRDTPDVLSFGGGDLFENATKDSPGASSLVQKGTPEVQIAECVRQLAPIQHKMLFSIPGNHEDRTFNSTGMDSARRMADSLKLPYFPDYCFASLKWRGNTFRILAHHGSGGASTPGSQLNAARKDLPWIKADLIWSGHLHQAKVDVAYQVDWDQKTGEAFQRESFVIISPSYVKFFGGYAAKKRLMPGKRGLSVVTLLPDGRMDISLHANGKRL